MSTIKKPIIILLLAVMVLGAKCTDVDVTDPKVAATLTELNDSWRVGYQELLEDIGTRHFNIKRAEAFIDMKRAVEDLGFEVVLSEGDYYLSISIPAELMFSEQEWSLVRKYEEPMMRKIASKHLGIKGNFATLEPVGLMIEGKVTLLENDDGTDITLTYRLHEIAPQPPESILPRREYPPPYASKAGFGKIWQRFEELTVPIAGLTPEN